MGDKRIWRSVLLFRDEWPLLLAGFLLVFLQVACSMFIPQFTKAYQNAMCALLFLIGIKLKLMHYCSLCADAYGNSFVLPSPSGCFRRSDGSCSLYTDAILKSRASYFPDNDWSENTQCGANVNNNNDCFCSGRYSDAPLSVSLLLHCCCTPQLTTCAVPVFVCKLRRLSAAMSVSHPAYFCIFRCASIYTPPALPSLCRHRLAAGTACGTSFLRNAQGVNCCGAGTGILGDKLQGYFLTGGGTFAGIDYW